MAFAQVGRNILSGKRLDDLRTRLRKEYVHFFRTDWGLTYHSCRFCGTAAYGLPGLWKYGIRHYICDQCRSDADPTLPKRQEG